MTGVIPPEYVWVTICNDGEITHLISLDKSNKLYRLYEMVYGAPINTGLTSNNPRELESYI